MVIEAPKDDGIYCPANVLDGLTAIASSGGVLTGSGTMAREAAVYGVPAVSFFPNNDLLAVTNDRWRITVVQDGKPKGGRIPSPDLGSMLKSEVFLREFPPLDRLDYLR